MCYHSTKSRVKSSSKGPLDNLRRSIESSSLLPPLVVVSCLPLLPTYCYVNRGFTQWFHWVAVVYLLTKWKFLERFQVISGISICLGWYSALCYAAIKYGQLCLILYDNMPETIKDHIFHPDTGDIHYESPSAQAMMIVSHVLDLLGHPLLTYYFWRRHKNNGGTAADIFLSWPVIVFSYIYSRIWSMTHMLYNYGKPGYFYIGHDIYVMQHLDCWIPAYVAESLFYATVILFKLFGSRWYKVKGGAECETDVAPKLAYSESGVSRSSSMESLSMDAVDELPSKPYGTDWSRM